MDIKKLIKEETRKCLKEYFHSTQENRQYEVQEYLTKRIDTDTLREFCRDPRQGRNYVRQNHTEKFYWWASEDIENLFRNWR